MQQINGYWVDVANNRWDCRYCTVEQAEEYSATLINCSNCDECHNCLSCRYCRDCEHCWSCTYCHNCQDCENCRGCQNCDDCHNCRYCRGCRDCQNCRYCQDCKNYQDNPQRYVTPCIGSRRDRTTIYWLDGDVQVICGCFRGNLDEFEDRVRDVHGDNKHGRAYMTEISKVRALMQ